jgi:hypothetical protein
MIEMAAALSLRYVLSENTRRAMDGLPPILPCMIATVVRTCRVTERNEMDAIRAALRIKNEIIDAYVKVHGLFSKPCIDVAVFKEVGDVEKDAWRVIAREMKRIV